MSPFSFLKDPLNWLQSISDYRVTHSAAPNFAFDYCVEKIKTEKCQNLDLVSWQVAHTGAETVRPQTLKQFTEIFEPYGFKINSFYPGYGLAEATLIATTKSSNQKPFFLTVSPQDLQQNRIQESTQGIVLTGCGVPIQGTDLVIVDLQTGLECSPNYVGEIWISSQSIAQGYWRKEEETQNTFQASLKTNPEKYFLRTGDLGFIKNNELFITGRIKELIIIKGKNHYPQDIELSIQEASSSFPVNSTAAFSVNIDQKEELIIFQELNKVDQKKFDFSDLFNIIKEVLLKDFEFLAYSIYLLKRGQIPKTSSGKIQRNACRQSFLDCTLDPIANWTRQDILVGQGTPKTKVEAQLLMIIGNFLNLENIGTEDNIFDLGIDSLLFSSLFSRIEEEFNIALDFEKFLEYSTIHQIAELIQNPENLSTSQVNLYPIRINCFKVLKLIFQANLPQSEKISRAYNVLKIQFLKTGPDFLDYTLPYHIGTQFIRWFCCQKLVQNLIFCDRVQAIKKCLTFIKPSAPDNQVIEHNLISNFWLYWRLASLALSSNKNFDRWISVTNSSYLHQAYQQQKGVILLLFHVPMRPILMLLLQRWGFKDFVVIGSNRYTLELLNLSHLTQKMLLTSDVVTSEVLYAQFHQARKVLGRGGIVIIAPDGLRKQSGIEKPFFDRKCYIGRSFIEFVISLQSIAIPVNISMTLKGVINVQFLSPLLSDNSLPYTEQTHQLANQYFDLLYDLWKHDFGNVGWDAIDAFLEQS